MLRGAAARGGQPSAWSMLLGSHPLLVFAATFALFHLDNGSMLELPGLLGQKMAC